MPGLFLCCAFIRNAHYLFGAVLQWRLGNMLPCTARVCWHSSKDATLQNLLFVINVVSYIHNMII